MLKAPEIIETERLRLRLPLETDADAVFQYASDPEVTRYMNFPRHLHIATALKFVADSRSRWLSDEEYTWVITIKPSEFAIGCVGCRVRDHEADFGYILNRSYWSQGFATEAARAIVTWACGLSSLYRLWATCDAENIASAKVLEKAGLALEGLLRRSAIRPNLESEPRDTLVYAKIIR